ncbi:MAG: hypothetical protein L0Y58_04215 [Verrucomicrobia subdivision 3 bacterium]|nr:hypothetical protein [Limisphaerales bacterium]
MCRIEGHGVVAVGRWLRVATLKDEDWLEGGLVAHPIKFIGALRASGLPADIFAFSGPLGGTPDESGGQFELENVAVIRTGDYKAWWEGLPQEARKNTRRAAKRGIEIRSAALDDDFAAGIKAIYDETQVRQGRKFWHYGKDLDTVKRENGTYLDRCEFLGAYYLGQLVGFMKFVYVGDAARIMQILCQNAHQDKRPMIALIANAAEICHQKGLNYLIYGKFTYGRKTDSSITEFKRRLGFEPLEYRRYYIPLSLRGRIALRLGVHKGWLALLPPKLIKHLLDIRSRWLHKAGQRINLQAAGFDHVRENRKG